MQFNHNILIGFKQTEVINISNKPIKFPRHSFVSVQLTIILILGFSLLCIVFESGEFINISRKIPT